MSISRTTTGLAIFITGVIAGNGGCVVDDLPTCPGQCFEYTAPFDAQKRCQNDAFDNYDIAFTGTDPNGYHGRFCDHSPSIAPAIEAIDYLNAGGQLSDLSVEIQDAYISIANAVKSNLQFECITAAPGQCTNAIQVCTGIAADMYEQLIVDQTCVLELDGVEPIELGPGELCEFGPVVHATGPDEPGDHCTDTAGANDGADDTTGAEESDDTTGEMFGPFGNINALVSCDSPTHCEVDRDLLSNISTHVEVFHQEGVTLSLVDSKAQCGPGVRIGGLHKREHTTELADAFDLRNGDIIHELESTTIEDFGDAMAALTSLLEDPSTTIVLRRPEDSACTTLTVDVDVL